jgi:single-strand selective monofunctional uracil DNA glycosylase
VKLSDIARQLSRDVGKLHFARPVEHVYNPLEYAWAAHRVYLERFGKAPKEALLVGMNPGPWGMSQTGVPFGEVAAVRDWLRIHENIERPAHEHPKRPIEGFDCPRSEVSGRRVWNWARDRFGTPVRFFRRFFVWYYCPLAFLEDSGRNRTPDKLPAAEREPLFAACDLALRRTVEHLRPRIVIGIGTFAEARARNIFGDEVKIGRILHPSPASPLANSGWAEKIEPQLTALGL